MKVNREAKIFLVVVAVLAFALIFYSMHAAIAMSGDPVLGKLPLIREGLPGLPELPTVYRALP